MSESRDAYFRGLGISTDRLPGHGVEPPASEPERSADALARLDGRLEGVASSGDARRALAYVARTLDAAAPTVWDAFRYGATDRLSRWLDREVVLHIVDFHQEEWERQRQRRNGSEPEPPHESASTAERFRIRSEEEVRLIEPPPQLVDGIMPLGGLVALVGQPGSGKTFVALDWALSIAAGVQWVGGRQVLPGQVLYIMAEGIAALGARVEAWTDYQLGGAEAGVSFLTHAVQLLGRHEVDALLGAIENQMPEPPVLIVFDTLARCLVGGDENAARDMGLMVSQADRVREVTGATVLIVHHTNVSGERERGNTALRGAVDTLMLLKREEGYLRLKCEKPKDAPPFDDVLLDLTPHLRSAVDAWAKVAPRRPAELRKRVPAEREIEQRLREEEAELVG